jgi:uncharacterized phiE125 gp8 family phage protein
MPSKLTTPATLTPVSLAECKAQCRVDGADEDNQISLYLLSAIAHAEHVCNVAFMPQTWALGTEGFPVGKSVVLDKAPLIAVQSVKYDDAQGVEQLLAVSAYVVDSYAPLGSIAPAPDTSWPATRTGKNSVRVTYTCGFAGQAGLPQLDALRAWLVLRVGTMYQHRESLVDGRLIAMPFVDHLLDPYCTWQI